MEENKTGLEKDLVCRYVDLRIEELEKRFQLSLEAMDKALQLAQHGLEGRLDGMNEVRDQLKDQHSWFKDQMTNLLPRSEYVLQHDRLIEDIRLLREAKAMLEGKASQGAVNLSLLIAAVGIVLSIVALLLH